eukprot:NODE_4132_length_1932_cov_4.144044.p1 GENE.NODE_4132_length_1932_cov_4.144044~~NODE_4132_length_1932_cov_4.144044.p1  ORF type:complete len:485 (+),score=140.70 NODE_4132_length_1932_cov_4.144044:117-1571(+)
MSSELRRTVRFAISVAAQLVLPERGVHGGHTVGEGYSFEAEHGEITEADLERLSSQLQELAQAAEKVSSVVRPWREAVELLEAQHQVHAVALLRTRVSSEVKFHECRGVLRLALWPLLDDLGTLGHCRLLRDAPGFIAVYSDDYTPQQALQSAHRTHRAFARSLGVRSVGALNALPLYGHARNDYLLNCEFRQEAQIAAIAEKVKRRGLAGTPIRVIAIAGPSSSGKTTFANKLAHYLLNVGFMAKPLSVDHYYLPLDRQPQYQVRKMRSDVNYDSIESMDVPLVSEHIVAVAEGRSIRPPIYKFADGSREEGPEFDALPSNGILVIEGIHALNPSYTESVGKGKVFKVFVSPLPALQIDDCNTLKTTDIRFLRRTCRDDKFRNLSATDTLRMWGSVRAGEHIYIFPFQNDADVLVNSSADYEVPVLKTFLEPLLRRVPADSPHYEKAHEVLAVLSNFVTWPPHITPPTALLREFIGDGAMDFH